MRNHRKIMIFLICIITLVNLTFSYIPVRATTFNGEIVKNASFEEGLTNWSIVKDKGQFMVEVDSNIKCSGEKSAKLYNKTNEPTRGVLSTIIDNPNFLGKTLKITQSIKSENLSGYIKLRVKYMDNSWNQLGDVDIKTLDIKGTTSWNDQQYSIQVPNDLRIKRIAIEYIYDGCTGVFWIDQIRTEKTENYISNNLIKNSGFEEGISYWNTAKDEGDFFVETDSTTKKSGSKSIKMYNKTKNQSRGLITQEVKFQDVVDFKTLKVSQWVKTDKLYGSEIQVRVKFLDNTQKEIDEKDYHSLEVMPTEDWKQISYNIAVPQNISFQSMQISYIFNQCYGSIWLDDISVEKSNINEDKNIIQNGSFEASINSNTNGLTNWQTSDEKYFTYDSLVKKDGKKSLKYNNTSNDIFNVNLSQYIGLVPNMVGKDVKITQWVKSSALKCKSFKLTIDYFNKDGNIVEYQDSKNIYIGEETDWKLISQSIDIPNDPQIVGLSVKYTIKGSGSLWIDCIRVEPYTKIDQLNFSPSLLDMNVGESKSVQIGIEPKNSTKKINLSKSFDQSMISIDKNNLVKALKKGVTKLKIEEPYQGISAYLPVVIGKSKDIQVNSVNNLSCNKNNVLNGSTSVKSSIANLTQSVYIPCSNGYVDLKGNGDFQYSPNKNFSGKDSFTILISDNLNNFSLVQYNIEVKDINELSNVSNFLIKMKQEEGKALGKLNVSKLDLEGTEFTIVKKPSNGNFTMDSSGAYTFEPNKNFNGYDSVEIRVSNKGNFKNVSGTIYVAPSVIVIDKLSSLNNSRVIANKTDFDRIKTLVKTDPNAIIWFGKIKAQVDGILNKPTVKYEKADGVRISTVSKNYIEQLGFMYKITGDTKYARRAWDELQNICQNYPDWNDKGEFLNTASMTIAASIGYDWLSDYLNDKQKGIVEEAINNKALRKAEQSYLDKKSFFVNDTNNWNFVCNSAMIVGAIAINKKDTRLEKIIQSGLESIQNSLTQYYSDGSGQEGPRYWSYVSDYLLYLDSTLKLSLQNVNNLGGQVKIDEIAMFPSYITGESKLFNFSDSEESDMLPSYYSLWAAKQTNNAELTRYHKKDSNYISIYDLLWYDPKLYKTSKSSEEKDKIYDNSQVAVMHSAINDNSETFLGLKGGVAGGTHGDLDVGSFVYDALGTRWAIDLGTENYNSPGYWDTGENGYRWFYYRKRAEGHNTLTIGSSNNEDQVVGSYSRIIRSSLNTKEPYLILDMTPAYSDKAVKVQREIKMLNNRKNIIINDDFVLKNEDTVVWQMHTKADITIVDNGRGAILEQDYKKLYIKINSNNMTFLVEDAVPNIGAPNPSGQTKNIGVKKLVVKTKAKAGSISIQMTPLENEMPLILNSGFEDGMKYWNTWKASGDFVSESDSTIKKSGSFSTKMYNRTPAIARGSISQIISGDFAGKLVKLSQNIKSDKLDGMIKIRTKFMDDNLNQIGDLDIKTIDISGTRDWENQIYSISVPNDSRIKKISIEYLYDNCIGTVWMDDIVAQKADSISTNNILKNADFEEGLSYWNTWKSSGEFTAETDKVTKKTGIKSIKMYNKTPVVARGSISQIISGDFGGKLIKLSQNIKSDKLDGMIKIRTKFMDNNLNQIGDIDIKNINISKSSDWVSQLYSVQVPKDSRINKISIEYLYDTCTGTIWLDNMSCTL